MVCRAAVAAVSSSSIDSFLQWDRQGLLVHFAAKAAGVNNLTPLAFAAALKECAGSRSCWSSALEIHAKAIRHCLGGSHIIGNVLIDFYAKNGAFRWARSVFKGLSFRDNVTWVAMISACSRDRYAEDALGLYCEMHQWGVAPTPYVLSSILSACSSGYLFLEGLMIHACVTKQGFGSVSYVGNALITLYSRCGNLASAESIFGATINRDKVTYNALISGHSQFGDGKRALEIFREMKMLGLQLDCLTITSVLTACSSRGYIWKGRQLHSFAWKTGMSSDYVLEGSLLDLYAKCMDIESASELFKTVDKMNVVTWNVMLVAFGQAGDLAKSFDLFRQMQAAGVYPNQFTYPSLLRTCASCVALELGRQIHSLSAKTGFESNLYVSGVLIDMYSKCGRFEEAKTVLNEYNDGDVVSWTSIVASYTQHGYFQEALRSFKEMLVRRIWPDNIGLASALCACAGTKGIRLGLQLHAKVCVSGYTSDVSTENSLVHFYARCGRTGDAYAAFKNVRSKDLISWNGMISGFVQSGFNEEALTFFASMNNAGVECNMFTFGSAISASANMADIKQGKQIHAKTVRTGYSSEIEVGNALISLYGKCGSIQDANKRFSEMAERNEVSWNAIITCYSQHGDGLQALHIFSQMKKEGVTPNDVTFVGVLAACSHAGLVDEGISYFKSMADDHGIVARPDHFACVVDILGRAGKLEQAKNFVMAMPIKPDAMVWRTLLSACIGQKDVEIGEIAAKHLLELEP